MPGPTDPPPEPCPLCGCPETRPLLREASAAYDACARCGLAFLQRHHLPSAAAELAHYCQHDNRPDDPGYRAFLARLADPLTERLPAGAAGLDYGCGPGPTLSVMLEERGFEVALYDPLFFPDPAPLSRRYGFITCSEVVEHFHDPAGEFARLDGLLAPGGWLGVMTETYLGPERFAGWWYRRDPTHVCFYHRRTLGWIAERWGWVLERPGKNVALFRKPG